MAKKVKTKRIRKFKIDEFTSLMIEYQKIMDRITLPHNYIFTNKLYSIILNYDKWHREKYDKTIKQYLFEDYISFLETENKKEIIVKLIGLRDYTEEELLQWARDEKVTNNYK